MDKPNEDIKILKSLIRDLEEKVNHTEKETNERLNRMRTEIDELKPEIKNEIKEESS